MIQLLLVAGDKKFEATMAAMPEGFNYWHQTSGNCPSPTACWSLHGSHPRMSTGPWCRDGWLIWRACDWVRPDQQDKTCPEIFEEQNA